MKKRFYQRCVGCGERAFEFKDNPNGTHPSIDDILHKDGSKAKAFDCDHCGRKTPEKELGHNNLIAKEPTGYTKYKGATPIHWDWYRGGNAQYKNLVDKSLVPFVGLKGTILDIGYGDGLIASLLIKMGFKVIGIEPEDDGLRASKRMLPEQKDIRKTTIEEYVKKRMESVDYIYSMNTIEHVEDYTAFVKVMDSVREFAVIVTDNALDKFGNKRRVKELHSKEFRYDELEALFKDFRHERVELDNGSFIGIKVYAHGK